MKIQYKICALFALAVLLSGCSKEGGADPSSGEQLISFSPAVSSQSTKAEDIGGIIQDASFPTDRTFAMTAFRLAMGDDGNMTMTGGHIFMNMETVSFNSTDNVWKTPGHHYWPLSGGVYCLSFCPAPATLIANKMMEGMTADHYGNLLFTGIQVKHVGADTTAITDDALKTDANLQHAKIDLMTATSSVNDVQKRTSNTIPVTFVHALTQVKFSVTIDKDYSSHEYYETVGTAPNDTVWAWTSWNQFWLDEIKLTNIYSKATYSFSAPHWPGDKKSDLYTYYPLRRPSRGGTQVVYKIDETTTRDALADSASFGSRTPAKTQVQLDGKDLCILLIPQMVDDDATIQITLTSRTANMLTANKETQKHQMNDVTRSFTRSFKLKEFLPILVSGACVNINFTVHLDGVSVGVDYDDWEEGGSTEFVI